MSTISTSILALEVTFAVIYAAPTDLIKSSSLISEVKNSTVASKQAILLKKNRQNGSEEAIELPEASLQNPIPNIAQSSLSDSPKPFLHDLVKDPISVTLPITSVSLLDELVQAEESISKSETSVENTVKPQSIVAPARDDQDERSVATETDDVTLGEDSLPNILAHQSIEALAQESAANSVLHSVSSLALECLLPPLDDKRPKSGRDNVGASRQRMSLDLIKESVPGPVQTILNLWESDEDGKHDLALSEYDEESKTKEEDSLNDS